MGVNQTLQAAKKLQINLPAGASVLTFSDIHMGAPNDPNQTWVEAKLTEQLQTNQARPGVVVLNGDIFELWQINQKFAETIKAHETFLNTLKDYANQPNHKVVYIVGNHDGEVAWSQEALKYFEHIGVVVCMELELHIKTAHSVKKIVFNHSHQLDPDNAYVDPYDQNDFPFGQYVVRRIIPQAKTVSPTLFSGVEHLVNRSAVMQLIWSRTFYASVLPAGILAGLVLGFSLVLYGLYYAILQPWQEFLLFLIMLSTGLMLVFMVIAVMLVMKKLKKSTLPHFDNQAAKKVLAESSEEIVGYVTGHTHLPELKKIHGKLFANSGYGCLGLVQVPSRLGLPPVFVTIKHVSWCRLDWDGEVLQAQLTEISARVQKARILQTLAAALPPRSEVPRTVELQITPH